MSTIKKKIRKPNRFKKKKGEVLPEKIKVTRKEKLDISLPENKRKIQESTHCKVKVSTLKEEQRQTQEILLERKLTLSELLSTKKKTITHKSKNPAKITCYNSYEETEVQKKDRKPPKRICLLTERRAKFLNARQQNEEAARILQSLNNKRNKEEKAESKKSRVAETQAKSKEIDKAKEEKPEVIPFIPKGMPRKTLRSILNGRKDGRKNRQKDRIMVLRTKDREFLETYTTKKGIEKKRYIYIPNPEVRKVVVLDKTKPLPVFEKQKSED